MRRLKVEGSKLKVVENCLKVEGARSILMIFSKFVGYNVLRSKTKPRLLGENNFANQKKRSFSLCVLETLWQTTFCEAKKKLSKPYLAQ